MSSNVRKINEELVSTLYCWTMDIKRRESSLLLCPLPHFVATLLRDLDLLEKMMKKLKKEYGDAGKLAVNHRQKVMNPFSLLSCSLHLLVRAAAFKMRYQSQIILFLNIQRSLWSVELNDHTASIWSKFTFVKSAAEWLQRDHSLGQPFNLRNLFLMH